MKERALARPRGADDEDHLSPPDPDIDTAEDMESRRGAPAEKKRFMQPRSAENYRGARHVIPTGAYPQVVSTMRAGPGRTRQATRVRGMPLRSSRSPSSAIPPGPRE